MYRRTCKTTSRSAAAVVYTFEVSGLKEEEIITLIEQIADATDVPLEYVARLMKEMVTYNLRKVINLLPLRK